MVLYYVGYRNFINQVHKMIYDRSVFDTTRNEENSAEVQKTKNEKMSTDTYLYKHSKKKEAESRQWLDAVRQASL
jgi:hypothetical protein